MTEREVSFFRKQGLYFQTGIVLIFDDLVVVSGVNLYFPEIAKTQDYSLSYSLDKVSNLSTIQDAH